MNKEQIEMLFRAVKTDVELAEITSECHYIDRALDSLKRLKNAKLELIRSIEYKIVTERESWTHF